MPQPDDPLDADFDAQLQGLFQQAERAISHRGGQKEPSSPDDLGKPAADSNSGTSKPIPVSKAVGPVPDFLKPLIQGLEAVTQATAENTALLKKIEPAATESEDPQKSMLQLMADLRAIVEARNTVSQSMFSALHQELKGYKDGFLLQTVHRPIIRDLVTLYDDTVELHRQLCEVIGEDNGEEEEDPVRAQARRVATNMANNTHFILEVLARLEVTVMEPSSGKLDKLTQKVMSLESADSPEENDMVVRSLRRGFLWKDALLRPEEVVIKRWKREGAPEGVPSAKQ